MISYFNTNVNKKVNYFLSISTFFKQYLIDKIKLLRNSGGYMQIDYIYYLEKLKHEILDVMEVDKLENMDPILVTEY